MNRRQATHRLDGPVRILLGFNYRELGLLIFGAFSGYLSVSNYTESSASAVGGILLALFAVLAGLGLAYGVVVLTRWIGQRLPNRALAHRRAWYTQPDVYVPRADKLAKPLEVVLRDE